MMHNAVKVIVLLGVIFSQGAWADLLSCLGREELAIHRNKNTGAVYRLNQFFVNRMSVGKSPVLTGEYQRKICGPRVRSPSILLLKHFLLKGNRIFVGSLEAVPSETEALGAFFIFLLKIQEMAPDHICLEKNLPHYSRFIYRHKYLEENGLTLLREKSRLVEMFRVLERPDILLAKCR